MSEMSNLKIPHPMYLNLDFKSFCFKLNLEIIFFFQYCYCYDFNLLALFLRLWISETSAYLFNFLYFTIYLIYAFTLNSMTSFATLIETTYLLSLSVIHDIIKSVINWCKNSYIESRNRSWIPILGMKNYVCTKMKC